MADQFKSSFIPKKTVEETRRQRKTSTGLFMTLGIVIFVISLVLAGGAFFFKNIVEGNIESKKEALARTEEAFEPSLITDLARLDKRLRSADQILNDHIAPSELFALLEEITLEPVQFTSLSFSESAQEQGRPTYEISMDGIAEDFSAVALQSDEFGFHPSIFGPLFSNITLDGEGGVSFSVTASVNQDVLSYDPPQIMFTGDELDEPENLDDDTGTTTPEDLPGDEDPNNPEDNNEPDL